jgi:Ca2+-transporting ATPase
MSGLTPKEVLERQKQFGLNQLEAKEFSALNLFFSQFKSPLIYILVFAGTVTFFLKDFNDTVVIFMAVVLNTALGFYQEFKAQKSLAALRGLLALKAKVIRNSQQQVIDARTLVPGDLVVLGIGDRVPADGVLVEATDLSVNEALLTGESMPVKKTLAPKEKRVFMGTIIVTGIAKMTVEKTGMETEMGKIGHTVEKAHEEKTPLQAQLGKLAKTLTVIVGLITAIVFVIGEWRGYEPLEMFTVSVAVAVAAIPEGLAVTLTVILALGMQRILRRKAIVRQLLAAETLGSVSCICADKTGTLTEGQMRVVKADSPDEQLLLRTAVLCNDMRDPLEEAMIRWSKENLGEDQVRKLKEEYRRLEEIPFSPETKLIATLNSRIQNQERVLYVSGAPEVVLDKSEINSGKKSIWQKKFEEYGQKGYRLVGFAWKKMAERPQKINNDDLKGLTWLGVLVYEDPVRQGVKEVLEECQAAGIKVKVITGDYLPTALAVLERLGMDGQEHALTGDQLAKLSLEGLKKRVGDVVLFARTDPGQKLKIVQALKENGEVVAMMGDGVNDAPALKQADIGVVVNEASDVAKETAEMVLLDSNFETIVKAIEEGRRIFENVKKAIVYLLSDSFCEIILVGGSLALGLPLPVTAAQILWVNLAEDALPAIALAFEPLEKRLMKESPRERETPLFDAEVRLLVILIGIVTDLFLFFIYWWLSQTSMSFEYLQTFMFVALGIDALFIVFACRSLQTSIFHQPFFSNLALIGAVGIGISLLLLAVYLPGLQALLGTQALGVREWLLLLGVGVINLAAVEIAKYAFFTYGKLKRTA